MTDLSAGNGVGTTPADHDGRFAVTSPLEIGHILQALARREVLLTADVDGGGGFFLTSIVAVDAAGGQMWLRTATSQAQTDRMLRAPGLTCTSNLEKVQIQFACCGMQAAAYDGRPAFRVALPQTLTRLQRREHFRLPTPGIAPLKCTVTIVRDGKPRRLDMIIADISCGGLALTAAPGQFEPVAGESYPCTIALPGTGALNASIELHHTHIVKDAHGNQTLRWGFAFVDPRGPMVAAIQRYIMQVGRERRARTV